MELSILKYKQRDMVVLFDDEMKIVEPVYNYLKFKRNADTDIALNTLKAKGSDLKIYWEFLCKEGYEYKDVTPNIIGEFVEYLREPNITDGIVSLYAKSKRVAATINRMLSTLNDFYKYCGTISNQNTPMLMEPVNQPWNMCRGLLHHTRNSNKTNKSIFKVKESGKSYNLVSEEKAEIFINELPTWRDKLIFKILYYAGARIGEVLALQIKSIPYPDSSKEIMVLNNILSKGKRRNLYLPVHLIEEIDNFIMQDRNNIDTEHGYIFVAQQKQYRGKPLTYRGIYEVFKRVKKKTGVDLNFHDLRHSYSTSLEESGMDISIIQQIMGHSHLSTTLKYIHLSEKFVTNVLSRYWQKSSLIGGGQYGNEHAKK